MGAALKVRFTEVIEKYEYYDFYFTERDLQKLKEDIIQTKEDREILINFTFDDLIKIMKCEPYPKEFQRFKDDIREYMRSFAYNEDYQEDYGDVLHNNWELERCQDTLIAK